MAPIVDPVYRAALEAEASPIVSIFLLAIEHEDLPQVLRFTSDNVTTIHQGNAYLPAVFEAMELPAQGITGQRMPTSNIAVGDPSNSIYRALRQTNPLKGPPILDFRVIGSHAPDVIQRGPWLFRMTAQGEVPPNSIAISFGGEPWFLEPLPSQGFNPGDFGNLYGSYRLN